ncbi:MAG: hypothetical protein IK102_02925 [Treponema sp.]|nr:hypothetical protein [Treponema sp.]
MKKTLVIILIAAMVVVTGCDFRNLAIPETVSIKTKADYEFSVAKLDSKKQKWLDVSQMLDFGKLIGGEDDGSEATEGSFKIMKYNDGSDYQQFLMHMKLKSIDFDLGSNFGDMDFSNAIEGFSIPAADITIPDVGKLSSTQKLDLTSIKTALNAAVTFVGVTAPSASVNFTGDTFEEVEYSSGYFVIKTEEAYEGTVALYDGDITVPTNKKTEAAFNGDTAKLSIAGITMKYSGMHLVFSGAADKGFIATIESTSSIKTATKVTIDSSKYNVQPVSITFPLNMGDSVESCTINTGSMSVVLDRTGWTDVITNYNIAISGALTASFNESKTTQSLNNQILSKGDIKADATVTLSLNNANINFENEPQVSVNVTVSTISATVNLGEGYTTPSFNTSTPGNEQPITSDITDYIKSIAWNPSGFRVKAKSTLPTGNNIGISIQSSFLGINHTETIPGGGTSAEEQVFNFLGTVGYDAEGGRKITQFTDSSGANYFDEIDINASVSLPGDSVTDGKITVTNVQPGASYALSLTIEPVLDWASADIKMSNSTTSFTGAFESNINKAELFKSFGESFANGFMDKLSFSALPLYFFASVPDLSIFNDANFGGVVKVYYGKKAAESAPKPTMTPGSQVKFLIGEDGPTTADDDDVKSNISLKGMPALVKNAAGEVTTKFNPAEKLVDFSNVLDMEPPDGAPEGVSLCVDYNVGLGGSDGTMTITKADVDSLKTAGKTKISVDIVMLLTMQFNVKDKIEINVRELANPGKDPATMTDKEKDLLGRDSADSASALEKYLSYIPSARLELIKPKLPLKCTGGLSLSVQWASTESPKVSSLKDGEDLVIEVNPSKLLSYPLDPQIKLVVGKGSFGLPKDMSVETALKLGVTVDGTIPVYPFNAGGSN